MNHSDSIIPAGGTGGLERPTGRSRDVMRIMQSAIKRGIDVGESGLRKSIAFAESVLDDPMSDPRDKMRASEFMATIAHKGIDVALHCDKREDENEQDTVTTVVVQRVSRNALIPSGDGNAPALPRGPVADDRQRPTLQRGDVRQAIGQDDDGRVPSV
jgi:hypothetical protein